VGPLKDSAGRCSGGEVATESCWVPCEEVCVQALKTRLEVLTNRQQIKVAKGRGMAEF
jgi:hypothetical protein